MLSKPIAHKGLHSNSAEYPESPLVAFKEAIKRGCSIELDVRMTKDKHIIVFQDMELTRLTGRNKNVQKTAYREINKLRLYHNTERRIPLLIEVLLDSLQVYCSGSSGRTIGGRKEEVIALKDTAADRALLC